MDLARSVRTDRSARSKAHDAAFPLSALPALDFMPDDRSIVLGQVRAKLIGRSEGIISYVNTDARDFGWCQSETRFDACTAFIDLAGSPSREQWYDDRHMWVESYGPNTVSLLDRSYKWRSFFTEPVKWVLFHVPRHTLREYALQMDIRL